MPGSETPTARGKRSRTAALEELPAPPWFKPPAVPRVLHAAPPVALAVAALPAAASASAACSGDVIDLSEEMSSDEEAGP